QEDVVAVAACLAGDRADEHHRHAVVGVGLGDHQTDDPAAPRAQGASSGVRMVAELGDRLLDTCARALGDGAGAGEHVADGRLGDAGESGDVLARGRRRPPPPAAPHAPAPSEMCPYPSTRPVAPVFHVVSAVERPSAESRARAWSRASSSSAARRTVLPDSAERTAASTIAWVQTLAWTSVSGTGPPRSAAQKFAREASSSQRSSAPGVRPRTGSRP